MAHSLALVTTLLVLVAVKHTAATCAREYGYTYIIGEGVEGVPYSQYYKVGGSVRSGDVRAKELQIGNPRPLYVNAEWPVNDCYNAEEAARRAAAETSAPVGHEWFFVEDFNVFYGAIDAAVAQYTYEDKEKKTEL